MKRVRARFVTATRRLALICGVLLLCVTAAAASPITIGTFEIQNDTSDLGYTGPTFVVTNDSAFAGHAATFGDVHLRLTLTDSSALDFLLSDAVTPGGSVDSNGLIDALSQSLLPDLSTVLDAYITLTLLDQLTSALLPGTVSLGPTDPLLCLDCTNRMTSFTHGSTLAIQFDSEGPVDTAPIPEPASLLLVGSGILSYAARKRWLSR
jgi:hypothetical protein